MTHSTNYYDVLIEVAPDSTAETGVEPKVKTGSKTIARLTYEILRDNPYQFSSDDILFEVYAIRKGLSEKEQSAHRKIYFSKGQPCFRASPLAKTYGWGFHSNREGKVALFAVDSKEYLELLQDENVVKKKAMRSKRV